MHTVVDVHPRASTDRMWGGTDLRFCTYTCTELPHVPLCSHFATYYSFPEKKSVPELSDQPTYIQSIQLSFLLFMSHTVWTPMENSLARLATDSLLQFFQLTPLYQGFLSSCHCEITLLPSFIISH